MSSFKKSALSFVASLAVVSVFGAAANAAVLYPNDYSFETPDASANPYYVTINTSVPAGTWSMDTAGHLGAQVVNYNFPLDGYANSNVYGITGNQYLNTWSGYATSTATGGNHYITQTLADTIQANTQYQLSADLTSKDLSFGAHFNVSLTIKHGSMTGPVISTYTVPGTQVDATNTTLTTFSTSSMLPDQSLVGQALCVTIQYLPLAGDTSQFSPDSTLDLDNVRINTTTTPEPSTLVLLGAGLFGLLAYAWRKRR